jgi:ABC-type transport system involved in cytochrome bd biosynthesis fused ATPase/permease subunit
LPSEDRNTTEPDSAGSRPEKASVLSKQVVASYIESGAKLLSKVNLNVKAGEKVGLAGRTCSGKSIFLAALFGLLHLPNGHVVIDDI